MDVEPRRTHLSTSPIPKVLIVIPARWASTRFPGKPLHLLAGKPLVQHVWERCKQCKHADKVVIATDDQRIAQVARRFNAVAVMTQPDHPSGTDRVAETAQSFPQHQIVINVQGDEPLISPALIDELAETLIKEASIPMITAAAPIEDEALLPDPNVVKVVLSSAGDALYFSRSPIPYVRDAGAGITHYRHLGIYGFQRQFLFEFVSAPPSLLERTESLEQLRALENGARIRVVLTRETSPGVDTPEQAAAIENLLQPQT
ncbi:3-deoxy-manno-octulosonate cytidylyltransferase [Phragmitibacter flavus]|uniref:3-deoxy-manno-octulosonate cytidylyltransferase n=1 Tax=Phragmitibacter flavus TaxID=2576071 RepID=A0A5R8KJJ5_9BACT|nr:3-deoxy-manno-octulosonate cytidylyltransferase [Phragmitibacter flavus]